MDGLNLEPLCDNCGNSVVTVSCESAGLCDDCAADKLRAALLPLMGKVCASVSRHDNGHLQMCLAPFGVEHDHS